MVPNQQKSAVRLSTVGEKRRQARPLEIFVNDALKACGLTLKELCGRHGLPYTSYNQVIKSLRGCSYPRRETLERLAAALSVEMGTLIHPDSLYQLNSPWLEEIDLDVLPVEVIERLGYE